MTEWRDQAACKDTDLDYMVAEPTDELLDVCAGCPVKAPCLTYALNLRPSWDFGIWAGTTRQQRRRLRRATA